MKQRCTGNDEGMNKHSVEREHPSVEDEADVKEHNEHFISASKEKKNNNDPLFHAKKKIMSDREIFDSVFLSDHPWEEHNDE